MEQESVAVDKRDTGVYVLIYKTNGELLFTEKASKKEILSEIEKIGSENVVRLYSGAKERPVRKVVSYTF